MTTLASGKANRIIVVELNGVRIETDRSIEKGTGPELVPAWMFELAWDRLRTEGSLTAAHLQSNDGLNVKRSSVVCALLAQLPGVRVASSAPIELRYERLSPRA